MTLDQAITRISYALRGVDDEVPTEGDEEYIYWTETLNRKKDELYEDVIQRWSIAYEERSLGTISVSSSPVYNLPTDFLAPSTSVYITTTDDTRVEVELVHPEEKNVNNRNVFVADNTPQKLYFTTPITTGESIVGGTLYMPGYYLPADVSDAADSLIAPDPNWLVMATAAEVAFNDIVYEAKAPDLNAKANNLYKMMTSKNRRGTFNRPRKTPYANYRIKSAEIAR